ncbi:unnamed protein product [Diatraea saccharalis]|uniref:Uncharacterized protein n=1 Tax=Diatraea saccharalis TaxID=40085 RepID=A0A9N9RA75_9NEOP|nr:unnamed protein product [Diatraea saccharalis]
MVKKCHYNLQSQKIYLSAELNLCKIHKMFYEEHLNNNVAYETYRNLFNKNFNIIRLSQDGYMFYLRRIPSSKKHLEIKISSLPDGHEKSQVMSQLRKLEILAHKKRA